MIGTDKIRLLLSVAASLALWGVAAAIQVWAWNAKTSFAAYSALFTFCALAFIASAYTIHVIYQIQNKRIDGMQEEWWRQIKEARDRDFSNRH